MHFNREIIFYFRRGSGLRRIRQNNNPMVVAIDRPLPPTHLFIGRLNHGGTGGPPPPVRIREKSGEYERKYSGCPFTCEKKYWVLSGAPSGKIKYDDEHSSTRKFDNVPP